MEIIRKNRVEMIVEKYEKAQHLEFLPDMYGAAPDDSGGGMGAVPGM